MPKAVALTPAALSVPTHAATSPRSAAPVATAAPKGAPAKSTLAKPDQVPLQLRIPRADAKKIRIAAAEAEETISAFMLACFHAYIKSGKA